jgi:two-component system chemotaxis response regulator CheB
MLGTTDKRNGHAPSVEVLFESIAEYVGSNALGVLSTDMVRDGANPLLDIKNQGFYNIVQYEDISVS